MRPLFPSDWLYFSANVSQKLLLSFAYHQISLKWIFHALLPCPNSLATHFGFTTPGCSICLCFVLINFTFIPVSFGHLRNFAAPKYLGDVLVNASKIMGDKSVGMTSNDPLVPNGRSYPLLYVDLPAAFPYRPTSTALKIIFILNCSASFSKPATNDWGIRRTILLLFFIEKKRTKQKRYFDACCLWTYSLVLFIKIQNRVFEQRVARLMRLPNQNQINLHVPKVLD